MPNPIKAITADDEAPLRRYLADQLKQLWPELQICAEARNGVEALQAIEAHRPDIAFLDIKMPGMTGMEVARRAADICHIVFITAYDQFAVQAFEAQAVDYLLKPVEPQRLAATVRRLQNHLLKQTLDPAPIHAVLQVLNERLAQPPVNDYLKWIKVSERQSVRLLQVEEICSFQAQDKYTKVQTATQEFLIRKTIKSLSEELNPDMFWQIHRSTIVNAAWIDKVSPSVTGAYTLTLKKRPGTLTVSRNFKDRFKAM